MRSQARATTITTPAPVASWRKTLPPIAIGFPVTISGTACPRCIEYVSIIQAIVCSFVAMVDRARANEKIELVLNKVVEEVLGEGSVSGVRLRDTVTGEESVIETDGLFVAIGHDPNTALFLDQLDHEPETGYLITRGKSTETNIPGVFAAGDVQDHVYRQAVTAAGSGCAAALDAERWLSEQRHAALSASVGVS